MKYIKDRKTGRIALLVFGIAFIFLLASCDVKKQNIQNNNDWENEVLYADECGFDGLRCCDNEEQLCKFGQNCCVNPKNEKENYCAENCDFGKENTFCRNENPACDIGLVCENSRCLLCGGEDQFCCGDGDACKNSLICFNNKCVNCGQAGYPCCDSELPCLKQDNRGNIRTECRNEICQPCGYGGANTCADEPFCNSDTLNNNGLSYKCGGLNQPCCDEKSCNLEEKLVCELGFCVKKN